MLQCIKAYKPVNKVSQLWCGLRHSKSRYGLLINWKKKNTTPRYIFQAHTSNKKII